MARKSFVQGAVILGIAGVIIKAMGAVFRIPLGNLIGDEGMAYYQAAYPIYVMFLMVATAGIPTAISRMVSVRVAEGKHHEAYRVFRISFVLLAGIGIVSAGICFFGAGVICDMIQMPGARYAMMAIAPALLFCPMMAAYRGYFQGQQNMGPTATSQIVEQFFRVALGLSLSFVLVKVGKQQAAAGAAFGATAGAIAGLITVMIIYALHKKSLRSDIEKTSNQAGESSKEILKKIFIIAVPITIGSAIMPIMNFIDVGLVVRRLTATGWDYAAAKSLYGQLSGFASPLINFPQVLTQSLAISMVPAIAGAYGQSDSRFLQDNVRLGLRFAVIIGFPCAFGLMVLAQPILLLLYPLQRESAISAAPCLVVMAFGVLFLSLVQTLTGVLQGIGKQMIPVRNLAIGALAKVFITYFATGIEFINVKGAALGTVAAYAIASILNLAAVKKYTGTKVNWHLTLVKPMVAVLVMAATAWGSYKLLYGFLGNALSCIVAILLAVLVYAVMIFATKSITVNELEMLPKGKKLAKIAKKFVK